MLAHTTGLTSRNANVSVGILYKAKAIIDTPRLVNGTVSVPFTCKYSTAYNIKNSSGNILNSSSGLDKSTVTNNTYTCTSASCPADITLNCISDTNDSANKVIDLTALRATIKTFSVTPSTVQKSSAGNKINVNWSLSTHDSCNIRVDTDPGSLVNALPNTVAIIENETLAVRAAFAAAPATQVIAVDNSKALTGGENVVTLPKIEYSKIISLVCGDSNNDGIPEGIYAGRADAIRTIKLKVVTAGEI